MTTTLGICPIGAPKHPARESRESSLFGNLFIAMILFPKDFHDFLKLLSEHDVRYMIVGGYATGYHGYVRATGDLDIFVEVSESNAKKLVQTFKDFGFDAGVTEDLFLEKGKMVRAGHPPLRLEILTEITGVSFEDCYASCEEIEIDDVKIRFIGLGNLLKNKSSTGRTKDKLDVEMLGGQDDKATPNNRRSNRAEERSSDWNGG